MPKYYCDYCDVFLTHDSQAGRKQHNHGRRHQENVRQYYAQFLAHNVQAPGQSPMTFVELPEGSTPQQMPGMPGAPIMIRPGMGPTGGALLGPGGVQIRPMRPGMPGMPMMRPGMPMMMMRPGMPPRPGMQGMPPHMMMRPGMPPRGMMPQGRPGMPPRGPMMGGPPMGMPPGGPPRPGMPRPGMPPPGGMPGAPPVGAQ